MVNVVKEAGIPDWGGRLVLQIQQALGGIAVTLSALSGTYATLATSASYANDAAAAAGGVKVGAPYRNGSVVQVRVT